ncbi:MAG: PEP-CTERM sorting domain-containing protein [Phycisphaeraceae bacterium]|nr:PEP-CTERM sorting domain-containing protein [Phycisphaeraceae bacterium]
MHQRINSRFAVALLIAAMTSPAWASTGLFWQFQDLNYPSNSSCTAVAMRTAEAWPVVFAGNAQVFSLFATPSPSAPSNYWHQSTLPVTPSGAPIVAKSSPTGRVLMFNAVAEQLVAGSPTTGYSSYTATAGAFNNSGTLITAYNDQVNGFGTIPSGGKIIDMAFAPDGTLGVVTDGLKFYESYNGTWSQPVYLPTLYSASYMPTSLRLAYDAQSRPHIVTNASSNVRVFDFDTQTGMWTTNALGMLSYEAAAIAGTDNASGALGVAWVDSASGPYDLKYAYLDDTGTWITTTVVGNVDTSSQGVGLTFDYAGLPVISYKDNATYRLAYDPVLIPEPGTLMLAGGMSLLGVMRRRG